jgi:hypothetical protein
MNVFEDLIIELKEENLLERTVIELDQEKATNNDPLYDAGSPDKGFIIPSPLGGTDIHDTEEPVTSPDPPIDSESLPSPVASPSILADENDREVSVEPTNAGKEFFKKRAVNEVSGLQMVEHVFTGVEREYMKVVPKPFDDFNAKRALHTFVNIVGEAESDEHKAAELTLMQETEAWGMALNERDRNISVSNLRRYCENSRPALSSQALLALARFYRNSPYSESVRAKFDFVITRLFSRPMQDEKRVCLFTRDETIKHLNTLYNEWSSVPLYTADEDDSKLLLTGLSFDDLAVEAESASNFDQLTGSGFFGRLRLFKESISELFYAPTVTAAAIESNIRVGNAYVHLIDLERRKLDAASIESKYNNLDIQSAADTTGRTFDLAELDRQRDRESDTTNLVEPERSSAAKKKPKRGVSSSEDAQSSTSIARRFIASSRHANRWLVLTLILMVLLTAGLYFWADFLAVDKIATAGVQRVDVESSPIGEYVATARISGDAFYGLMSPAWDALPKDKREEFLRKVLDAGKEKGYKQVTLINKDGKQAGFASANRLEVIMP